VHDPACVEPPELQFGAVLWGPRDDQIRELPPLPGGDTVSAATALNDRGQVVGISGICDQAVGRFSAIHSVLWEHGLPIEIGDLGGVAWNTPMAINHFGDARQTSSGAVKLTTAASGRDDSAGRPGSRRPLPRRPAGKARTFSARGRAEHRVGSRSQW
jgi:hypothetical protein